MDITDEAKEKLARRQANAAVALLKMDRPEKVWPLLKHSPDPTVRSHLIHRLAALGADPSAVMRRLDEEKDVSARRALLLCLGEWGPERLPAADRDAFLPRLLATYRDDPDPGIHGAAEWLLRQWKQEEKIRPIDQQLATGRIEGGLAVPALADPRSAISDTRAPANAGPRKQWYINSQGHTMVILPAGEFTMGSPNDEKGHDVNETLHRQRIARGFAIASKAVTVAQFKRFAPDFDQDRMNRSPEPDCPIPGVTWYEAAAYCNWLSKTEGIPEDQWCYMPNSLREFAEGMKLVAGWSKLTGYRLPSEAEWEYACRAGAVTSWYYGRAEELLGKYAWYSATTRDERTFPVARLKPNDFGLFDMNGNVYAWCQDQYASYPLGQNGKAEEDREEHGSALSGKEARLLRGGGFNDSPPGCLRSADRHWNFPGLHWFNHGIRVARTCN